MEIGKVLDLLFNEYGYPKKVLIHAGASYCQERDLYKSFDFE